MSITIRLMCTVHFENEKHYHWLDWLHFQLMTKGKTILRCTVGECNKTFSTASAYQVHVQRHNNNFKFVCCECGKGFMNKNHLDSHTSTHSGLKEHECHKCQKKFVTKSSCTRHAKSCNLINRKIECSECGKFFLTKKNLNDHLVRAHKASLWINIFLLVACHSQSHQWTSKAKYNR